METTKQTLKHGNYMKVKYVNAYFAIAPTHLKYVKELPQHKGRHDIYYSTEDLKSIMSPGMFNELEHICTTFLIV
jgi:hypothetical protein